MLKILILRPDNIGDVVLFSGALRHIRELYPGAYITLALQAHVVNLLELCPYIDRCIPVDYLTWLGTYEHREFPYIKNWLKRPVRAINRLFNTIVNPFDIIIYPIKSPRVRHLEIIKRLNAKQVYGITGCNLNSPADGYPSHLKLQELFTNCFDVSNTHPWVHELVTTLNFVRFMGCQASTVDEVRPQLWFSDSEINHFNDYKIKGLRIIGLFPGASFEGRCWDSMNYGDLVNMLGSQALYVIFGSQADVGLADRVTHSIKEKCKDAEIMDLSGLTTLRELAKAISLCNVFIGMETSGLHMAIAAGVPTVGIVGGGHFGRFVPWGNPREHIVLAKEMECFHCHWRCNQEQIECIQGVTSYEVAKSVRSLLKMKASKI